MNTVDAVLSGVLIVVHILAIFFCMSLLAKLDGGSVPALLVWAALLLNSVALYAQLRDLLRGVVR